MVDPASPDAEKIAAIRAALPATGAGIYLDVATAGPFPAETARALQEADDWELRVGRVGPDREADIDLRDQEARAVIAALIGADPDDIVLTFGNDDSVGLLFGSAYHWLDARLLAGAVPIDVNDLRGDEAVVLDGHRWLLGPEGTGAIWFGPGVREGLDQDQVRLPRLPRRSLLGLARSVGWIEMYVGLPWVYERTARLGDRLTVALAAIDGVLLLTPPTSSAIASFRIRGWNAEQAQEELSRRVFAIVGAEPKQNAIRASVGFWNTEDELDRFTAAVAELAAHTPESLPRRPSLVILP